MTAARAGQGRAAHSADHQTLTSDADVLALPHPDWLHHHLTVTGDADLVTLFRRAAAGPGAIPWADDLAPQEEDWFHLLAAPPDGQRRALSLHGARVLAGQRRDVVQRRRDRAAEGAGRAGGGGACPLDLYRLLAAPTAVLRLRPRHPEARRWLWAHWGTIWPLRLVAELPAPRAEQPRPATPGLLRLGF